MRLDFKRTQIELLQRLFSLKSYKTGLYVILELTIITPMNQSHMFFSYIRQCRVGIARRSS